KRKRKSSELFLYPAAGMAMRASQVEGREEVDGVVLPLEVLQPFEVAVGVVGVCTPLVVFFFGCPEVVVVLTTISRETFHSVEQRPTPFDVLGTFFLFILLNSLVVNKREREK